MEFFDNALNKTKEALDVACKKVDGVVSLEKLKIQISSLKSKRQKEFTKLGEAYFEVLKDAADVPENVKKTVSDIKEKNAEIERLTVLLAEMQNRTVCPYCGAHLEKNSVYCKVCGKKLDGTEE